MDRTPEEIEQALRRAQQHLEQPLPGHANYDMSFYDGENEWMNEAEDSVLPEERREHIEILQYRKGLNIINDDECVICLENFKPKIPICVLPCRHAFHPKCMDEWIENGTTCPICRAEI